MKSDEELTKDLEAFKDFKRRVEHFSSIDEK
jgi:hypothetical protein